MARETTSSPASEKKLEQYGVWVKVKPQEGAGGRRRSPSPKSSRTWTPPERLPPRSNRRGTKHPSRQRKRKPPG